ncbi:MAG: glycosyltransferase [Gammaproteobacteria bacterium]|nr:MAG: glycosyltransferase [Gammaproteobacteria bacterium]
MSEPIHMLDWTAWLSQPWLRWPITTVYLILMSLISIYGLHRYWLVLLFNRHRRDRPRPKQRFKSLPRVTVQLPMFNESRVASRIIDAACNLDYPRDRIQIQVLDDSNDGSLSQVEDRVNDWQASGVDIQLLHRTDRTGYKAGALQAALPHAKGELIAIFDADFIPPPSFLRRTVHYFTDPKLGMVQTRWTHLNRDDSMLTRGQAIFLDGHFVIEHNARNRCGAWINFNGTAGIWRREAIESAGGWHHDTLTEDVDLSYRAQLAGWTFLFLPWVQCPAELPPEINAFKSQQHRWTKGSIQTAIKLLPALLRAKVTPTIKLEAFFHLTSPMVYLYVTLLAVLFYPVIAMNINPFGGLWYGPILGMGLFALGTVSAAVFYITSQHAQRRSIWGTIAQVPLLMAIGIGIAMNNAIACIEALLGHQSPFVRTPKYNVQGLSTPDCQERTIGPIIPIPDLKRSVCMLEIVMGIYMLLCIWMSVHTGHTAVSLPFLFLFASGYFYVGLSSLWTHFKVSRLIHQPVTRIACKQNL